ncbi:MAG: hypothetical protein Q8L98_01200 [Chlamydiales bacterium]|nr:hypothetical protein [Chlamydiales bacterium]
MAIDVARNIMPHALRGAYVGVSFGLTVAGSSAIYTLTNFGWEIFRLNLGMVPAAGTAGAIAAVGATLLGAERPFLTPTAALASVTMIYTYMGSSLGATTFSATMELIGIPLTIFCMGAFAAQGIITNPHPRITLQRVEELRAYSERY